MFYYWYCTEWGRGKYEWGRGGSEQEADLKTVIRDQVGGHVRLKLGVIEERMRGKIGFKRVT